MIRRGRTEGWLREPIEGLPTWASFHGVNFNDIQVGPLPGFEERGSTVIAARKLSGEEEEPLMTIPKELILSKQTVELIAKADQHLREVLQALDDFGRTTRGAVLTFLLMQATICCPDFKDIGVHTPLTEYIKYLPDELLPTFWSEEEVEFLEGTTLRSAVRAKMNSLLREFESFRTATENIGWCAKSWWDEESGLVSEPPHIWLRPARIPSLLSHWMRSATIMHSLMSPSSHLTIGCGSMPCTDLERSNSLVLEMQWCPALTWLIMLLGKLQLLCTKLMTMETPSSYYETVKTFHLVAK